jgi:hypothetical protein
MPFWNPLIGGKRVLELTYSNPTSYRSTLNPSGPGSLRTWVDGELGDPTAAENYDEIIINFPNDYYFGSPSPSIVGVDTGNWDPKTDIVINNDGYFVGKGGAGGAAGGPGPSPSGGAGGAGGSALTVPSSMKSLTINNQSSGTIASGGRGSPGSAGGQNQIPQFFEGSPEPPAQQPTPGSQGDGGAGYGVGIGSPPSTIVPQTGPGPISFRAGGAGSPLGGGSPAAEWINGPGLPKVTLVNNGNIYGPSPIGQFPSGPATPS